MVLLVPAVAPAAEFTALLTRTDTRDANPGDGTCADSSGQCSLRAAIEEANALPGRDHVHLTDSPTNRPPGLLLGEVVISDDLDLSGDGVTRTRVNGIRADRLLGIRPGVSVSLSDLTLAIGEADEGGIIINEGDLTLTRVEIKQGIARRGGGIFNAGTLTASDSSFFQHIGKAFDSQGGAIYNAGSASFDRVTFAKGQAVLGCGGAIYNAATGSIDALNATFTKNIARKSDGGAICNDGGVLRCTHCTIFRNRATTLAGGIANYGGTVELLSTLIAENTAAGNHPTDNCGGSPITSLGYNLGSDGGCDLVAAGDLRSAPATLRGLRFVDAGHVKVVPFKRPQAAGIDNADPAACATVDARGLPRPVGTGCDIGAFEHQSPAIPATRTSTPTLGPATATPTESRTATPSRTATVTSTATPTATDTGTRAPTATPTVPGSPTATATESPTPTASASATTTVAPAGPGDFWVDMDARDAPDAAPGDGICADAGGVCTLSAAVEESNATVFRDVIHLGLGTVKALTEIVLTDDVDILGSDMYGTVIQAPRFHRAVRVAAGSNVRIADLTLFKGYAIEGGLIYNEGDMVLERCQLKRGKAARGAGLYNVGSFSATDTLFEALTDTPPAGLGGCIHNRGYLWLERVTLKRGQARLGCGGGIYNAPTGVVEAVNLTVMRNRARRARAGGICNDGGALRCTHCTISRNQANNTAGGLLNLGGTVELQNSVVALNFHSQVGRGGDCGGDPIQSLGHNLDGGTTCNFSGSGDISNTDPFVRAVQYIDDGIIPVGAFSSIASPAIDAADPSACPALDGRGAPRPSGAGCDIGAYEHQF